MVCQLWLHNILELTIQIARLFRKIQFTYVLKNRSKRSLHQPQLCCFYQVLVSGIIYFEQNWNPLLEDKELSCCGKSRCETCFNIKKINAFVTFEKNVLLRFVIKNIYKSNHQNHFDSKCFIYLLYCKVCGLQCFRSTFDKFRW